METCGIIVSHSGEDYKGYTDMADGWSYAVGEDNKPATFVKLFKNWDAENGSFGANGFIKVPSGKTVTLDLRGKTIDRRLTSFKDGGNVITVESGGTLIINDNKAGTGDGEITGGRNNGSGGGIVLSGGTLILNGGAIKNNKTKTYGGGVFIDGGAVYMYGGKIEGNETAASGGGVHISDGTLFLYGGSIEDNGAAASGGGVYMKAADGLSFFQMTGGDVSNNAVSGDGAKGGGVYLSNGCTFSLAGGNVMTNSGSGVYMADGSIFNLSGGSVKENNGGVYVAKSADSHFKLFGAATVNGNGASNVYLEDGMEMEIISALPESTNIGVTTRTAPTAADPVAITGKYATDFHDRFHSDDAKYETTYDENDQTVKLTISVDAPVISPGSGTYYSAQTVEITVPVGASVYYTLDGEEPTKASKSYNGSFEIAKSCAVKAKAFIGDKGSVTSSADYELKVEALSITPVGGDYMGTQSVEIMCDTEDADIYYTIDGSDPTTGSEAYSEKFDVHESCTVKAMAVKTGWTDSDIASVTYNITSLRVDKPSITPDGGKYTESQTVTLACSTPQAAIYYTLGGEEPTKDSNEYTGEFAVSRSCTVKAVGILEDYTDSEIAEATFTINRPVPPPVNTVATPTIMPNGGTFETGRTVTLACSTAGAAIYYTVDGKDPTGESEVYKEPFTVSRSLTVKAKGVLEGMYDSEIALAEFVIISQPPKKPYVLHTDGTWTEYETITEALAAAKAGESVMVPEKTELTGDIVVPAGVGFLMGGNVYTLPGNDGRLIIYADSSFTTDEGEHVYINAPVDPKRDERSAYFKSVEVWGKYVNGGWLHLHDATVAGDGMIEVTATGEITLNGASALGKVKLPEGRTVTLGGTFKANGNAATLYLGDNYELGRKVLTLSETELGEYAKYFKLADAPDDSWYIGRDGALTSKPDPKESYLLLDKMTMPAEKKLTLSNLLPLNFKGGVTWTSDDAAIIKITGKGQKRALKAVKLGTANLTATFADGKSQTIPVSVLIKKDAVSGLKLKQKLTMRAGGIKTLAPKVIPATALDKTLKWFTTDEKIAAVSDAGTIKAVAKGKCKIYAITASGVRKTIKLTVKAKK